MNHTPRQAAQTQLTELLRSIPKDARAIYEHGPTESSSIPYGRLAHEAAAEIDRLRAALAAHEPLCLQRDHLAAIAAKDAEIAALKADAELRPIETAPRTGRDLMLILTPSGSPQVCYANTWLQGGFSHEGKPTHWRPLPPAPIVKESKA
jgi:hypothetical protein